VISLLEEVIGMLLESVGSPAVEVFDGGEEGQWKNEGENSKESY